MEGKIDFTAAYKNRISQLVSQNKVFLFMKGNKLFPQVRTGAFGWAQSPEGAVLAFSARVSVGGQCGFSDTAVKILNAVEADFETFDVLSDDTMRVAAVPEAM